MRQTIWLVIGLIVASVVLGAVGLHVYDLHRQDQARDDVRAMALAESYAVQAAEPVAIGLRTGVERFLLDLRVHADVVFAGVIDAKGRLIAQRGAERLGAAYLTGRSETSSQHSSCWRVAGEADLKLPPVVLAEAEILDGADGVRLGRFVVAVRQKAGRFRAGSEALSYVMRISLIAATGMVLGLFWLKQRVLNPLNLLVQKSNGDTPELARRLSGRGDEIGLLARTISEMQEKLADWRGRASDLQRTVDVKVTARTRGITRELNEAKKAAWTDPLTGLGNRRMLEEKFDEIFRSQREARQDLSIVMVDVDNFKVLNDNFGHKAGDDLLKFLGELLAKSIREQDLAIRYGGDEFMLILPGVSVERAGLIADRIVKLFAQRAKLWKLDPSPGLSAGVASITCHCPRDSEDLLCKADLALYGAKSAGKSRVEIGPSPLAMLS